MTSMRYFLVILISVLSAPVLAAEPSTAEAIKGCWDMRDTQDEITRRAEDPFYASNVRYCFDEEVAGEFVTRASEFNGNKDEAGNWTTAGGDGWDGGGFYTIDGDRLRLDQGIAETCNLTITGDVLTMTQCVADQTLTTGEPIEDTTWDRGAAMTAAAGYSGTPLAQKLGLKDGQRVLFISLPPSLNELRISRHFHEMAQAGWETWQDGEPGYDVIHGFTASRAVLEANAKALMDTIARDGTIWISWPKKASKVSTDITEDVIRDVVLPIGLVDVKVAAVDDIWSGLKLVIRKELR